MLKQLTKKEKKVTCKMCSENGTRLTFNDNTTQIQHTNTTQYKTVHING